MTFKDFAPVQGKLDFIALRTGAPHCRSLGAIQHPELKSGHISDNAHIAAKSIYLFDNLAFSYTADGRIAGHSGEAKHIHRYKKDLGAKVCGRHCSLTAGVAAADNNYVVRVLHQKLFLKER